MSGFSIAALQEARDEVAGQMGARVFFWAEVLHDMRKLLPEVEGFLRESVLICSETS